MVVFDVTVSAEQETAIQTEVYMQITGINFLPPLAFQVWDLLKTLAE